MMSPQAKARAFDFCAQRGFLTSGQIQEATDFGLSSGGNGKVSLFDVRTAIRSIAADAERQGADTRRHHLTKALMHVDEARKS
jgi:hypothetical protein